MSEFYTLSFYSINNIASSMSLNYGTYYEDRVMPENTFALFKDNDNNLYILVRYKGKANRDTIRIIDTFSYSEELDFNNVNTKIDELKKEGLSEISGKKVYDNFMIAVNSALIEAAKKGNLDGVKYTVGIGADPKYNDSDALQWAARNGHTEVVKYLVEKGADPTAAERNAERWAKKNGHTGVWNYLKSWVGKK